MTGYYVLAAVLLLFLGTKFLRWLRDGFYIQPAVQHVRNLQSGTVEEGLMASMGSLGVIYFPRVLYVFPDVVVVHVRAEYSRGGYPEHSVFHLVQLDRNKKSVLQCDPVAIATVPYQPG